MITRDELKQREYDGSECMAFKMSFVDEDLGSTVECFYRRGVDDLKLWDFMAVVDDGMHAKQLYTFEYEVPSKTLKLELIAAAGLMRFNEIIQNEVNAKQVLQHQIFEAVSGM